MTLKDKIAQWLKSGEIKKEDIHSKDIAKLIRRSKKDIQSAKNTLSANEELAYMAAYLGVLRAGRALMFAHGYRPSGRAHHKITFDFANVILGDKFSLLVDKIDDMRKRRNQFTYDVDFIDSVSEDEAKSSLSDAQDFIQTIADFLKNHWPSETEYQKL